MRKYYSQSDMPNESKSFLRFDNSSKYHNSIAITTHRGGHGGTHTFILDSDQVEDLLHNLEKWHEKLVDSIKMEGDGI